MGETDPDMRGAPKQAARNASQTLETGSGNKQQGQSQKPAQNGQKETEKRPTSSQLHRLYRKAEDAGFTKEQTDGRINYLYHKTPEALTMPEYEDFCKRMDETAKELRNGGNKQ